MDTASSHVPPTHIDDKNDSGNSEEYEESEEHHTPTPTLPKTHAVFVSKLYSMLHDPEVQNLISWNDTGDIIHISNPSRFSQQVLPRYFKHNNWQSFVRQLNMYGFHKVNDVVHSSLRQDSQAWEFRHPHFKRGSVNELAKIKRKSVRSLRSMAPLHVSALEDHYEYYNYSDRLCRDMSQRVAHIAQNYQNLRNDLVRIRLIVQEQQMTIKNMLSILSTSLEPSSSENITTTATEFHPSASITSAFEKLVGLETRFRALEEYTQTYYPASITMAPVASSSTRITSMQLPEAKSCFNVHDKETCTDSTIMRLGTGSHLLNPANPDPTRHA